MQSVLHLKTPDGKPPLEPNFDKITLRQLLDMSAGVYFERGGISYVVCWNGLLPHPELPFYPKFQKVLNAAKSHDWGDTDLFPQYGMPSF